MSHILAIDVGGTEIKYNVLSASGELLQETKFVATPSPKGPNYTWTEEENKKAKADYVALIERLIEESTYEITGLAVSAPGYINAHTGEIQFGGHLIYMNNTSFYELLAHLNIPIVIDNDARCVAMAEYGAGGAVGLDNFACITLGTGVGSGIMVHGKLIEGSHNRGGEYGASFIEKTADGKHLTFHDTCSMSSLVRRYKDAKGVTDQEVNGRMIFSELEDPVVAALVEDWYEAIAVAVYNLVVTFDSQKILIGGGVSARPDLAEKVVAALIRITGAMTLGRSTWEMFGIPVEACTFRNDSGLLGAFYRFQEIQNR